MSLFSKLFGKGGGAGAKEQPPEIYRDFRIYPEPQPEGSRFRLAARIEKEVDGETRRHQLIRADVLDTREDAVTAALGKARQVIDEQGERLFG